MTRRTLLQTAGPAAALQGRDRPNLLLVLTDDQSIPHAGCYGDTVIRTPNVDGFAREGMRFDQAYTTAPICSPSRASMLTGQPPQRVNMTRLHSVLPREHRTFLEDLRRNGYYTGVAGRTYHTDGNLQNRPWMQDLYRRERLPNMRERADFVDVSPQDQCVARFEAFLSKKPAGRPFALQIGFTDPHQPWTATEFEKMYNPADVVVPPYLPDTLEMRRQIVRYYAEITRADRDFGRILEALKRSGHEDNTVVVFMGDNGCALPFCKATMYQAGWHVPLLVRWPGRVKPGSSTSELVSGSDLYATFLEIAGLRTPDGLESHSFLPVLEGRNVPGRRYVYASLGWLGIMEACRAVRSRTHSLIYNIWPTYNGPRLPNGYDASRMAPGARARWQRNDRPVYELYDLRSDPYEFHNLAGSSEARDVETELKGALSDWMEKHSDFAPPPFINSLNLAKNPLQDFPDLYVPPK